MNEPSTFDHLDHTFPMTNLHFSSDGKRILHGELHNAYGQLMHKTTYEALLERDNYQIRPFVLTRSVFTGSQQYGPMWTGDNQAVFDELRASIHSILSLGVSGIVNSGSDIPGFYG
jgi:mannosyl-oligosaccharide alpha-1,3-glucosidase